MVGALMFAVHPLQVEAVSWVTSLKDLSSGLFACLALFCFIQFRIKNKIVIYAFGIASFLLAMLSKPTAVSVLPMILIIDFFIFKINIKNSIIRIIPWVLVAFPILILNAFSQGKLVSLYQEPWFFRPFIALDSMGFYLYKSFFPFIILPDYGRSPRYLIENGLIYWTWLPVAGLIVGSLIIIRHNLSNKISSLRGIFAGLFLFLAGLLAVSGLIPFAAQNNSTVYDRYVYLSMVGVALFFCFILASFRKNRKFALIIAFSLIIILGYKSTVQSKIWKNDFRLWSYTLSKKQDSVVALINLGRQFSTKGDTDRALQLYQKAVDIAPYDPDAQNNLGSVLAKTGKMNSAELHFEKAVKLNPRLITAQENLMRIYMLKYDWNNAQRTIQTLLNLNSRHVGANLNQAEIFLHKKQFKKCLSFLNIVKKWLKNNPDLENFIGVAYAGIGNKSAAQAHFKIALELNPHHKSATQNLSNSFRNF